MKFKAADSSARHRAFTLIELLTVIAIIGILASIIIPTVGIVMLKAKKVKTKGQLSQWAVAMETFKNSYGYYPQLSGTLSGGGSSPQNVINPGRFAIALTGRNLDGTALQTSAPDKCGNTKLIEFYKFASSDLNMTVAPARIKDAFDNTNIAVIIDTNGDGQITASDVSSPPQLDAVNGGRFSPSLDDLGIISAAQGLHESVIFYTPGNGNSDGSAIDVTAAVYSWK